MMLKDKVAVVYGAGGAIGSAVARAFAAEGAKVYATGRLLEPVQLLAKEIGGEAAEVDALDEAAIDRHLQSVVDADGRVDISFNAVGVADAEVVGVPFLDVDVERFELPIVAYTRSYFLTARLAARRMAPQRSGVIMTVSALPARMGSRLNGGYGAAQAAKEALTRDLSAEFAPQGIRVVALRPHGIPESATMRELSDLKVDATGVTWEQFSGYLSGSTHRKRAMEASEVGAMAALVASDRASGLTGTVVNMTMGSLDD
jgi:NAD(P)-dependent dehydrogenase (short-subunit alcohol dehydrogenase family)